MSDSVSEGSVWDLLHRSVPLIISQAALSIMMLTDRLVLSHINGEYATASMLGGFMAHLLSIFFMGYMNYVTPLSAQYFGAGAPHKSRQALTHGIRLAWASYPLILIMGYVLPEPYFRFAGIPLSEAHSTLPYFYVINASSIIFLCNTAFGSFFSGIGDSSVVMKANMLGMLANIPLATLLVIWGRDFIHPMAGSALATTISLLFMLCVFLYEWYGLKEPFQARGPDQWDSQIVKQFARYGTPMGLEIFFSFALFSSFVSFFHSYGPAQGLSATIVFNWDIIAFMFLWGLSFANMGAVGQAMGAGNVPLAVKSTQSAVKIAGVIALTFIFLFLFFPEDLVNVFLTGVTEPQVVRDVLTLAPKMLRMVSLYTLGLAANLIFASTLRSAGDTKVCMRIQNTLDVSMFVSTALSIRIFHWSPLVSWSLFVGHVLLMGLSMFFRYHQGSWKNMRMLA